MFYLKSIFHGSILWLVSTEDTNPLLFDMRTRIVNMCTQIDVAVQMPSDQVLLFNCQLFFSDLSASSFEHMW